MKTDAKHRADDAGRDGLPRPSTGAPERAILVAVDGLAPAQDTEDSLAELAFLARSAGAVVVATVVQKRGRPDAAYYVGAGKLREIDELRKDAGADLLIFDEELSPAQRRNIERLIPVRILDRTHLILDIFAQRAKSREGKLQVELAQLNYMLPRLAGRGWELSRLGGGIGTRGPGETKLEMDRRRVKRRIAELTREIEELRRHRDLHRRQRRRAEMPVAAIIGYTNAGKSTLLNALTQAQAAAEDKLFVTLDPLTRCLKLPARDHILLTDTVGFIRKLPHQLVAAFRATLEEVVEADLLIQVADSSHPRVFEQMQAVREVLEEIGAAAKPVIVALNKIDLVANPAQIERLQRVAPGALPVSALRGDGLEELAQALGRMLDGHWRHLRLRIPYGREEIMAVLHARGRVLRQEYGAEGIDVEAELPEAWARKIRQQLSGVEEVCEG